VNRTEWGGFGMAQCHLDSDIAACDHKTIVNIISILFCTIYKALRGIIWPIILLEIIVAKVGRHHIYNSRDHRSDEPFKKIPDALHRNNTPHRPLFCITTLSCK
jgi:hypothetical protein